jgi:3-oxoacyl-[acyl-carrier-protein] synthase II
MRRVVITGLGAITPLGGTVASTWDGIKKGKLGIVKLPEELRQASGVAVAARVTDFDPEDYMDRKEARRMDRFMQMAVACADQAWADAGFAEHPDETRVGVIMGSGIGGITTITEQLMVLQEKGCHRVSPFFIPKTIVNLAPGSVAIRIKAKGPCESVVSACATGADAIGTAFLYIKAGRSDVMVTGGSESAINPLGLAGFEQMHALAHTDDPARASIPFDKNRSGFVMGEGAAVLVLEEYEHARARGARIYAELKGYGQSCDAYHITAPHPESEGTVRAMRLAVEEGGVGLDEVDYINAHGTSTPPNDRSETHAIKKLFGERAYQIPVSSTKSMTGHLLGAAGSAEALFCALAVYEGFIPPTIGLRDPDPECDLDYVPNAGRHATVRNALSNAFGFGGHNTCLLISKMED